MPRIKQATRDRREIEIMNNKSKAKKAIVLSLLALLLSGVCCISSVLKPSKPSGEEQAPWTITITIYNNTASSYCRVWFDQPTIGLFSYIFTRDQLDIFERLKPGESIVIPDMYFRYGTYYLWAQECGTLIWDSVLVSGDVCGPQKSIHVGEPTGPSATQTVIAYPPEAAPTPLVTPQFTEQSGGFNGLYFYGSEDTHWTESVPNGKTHYIHTLLRFYEDGLVIGTYLEFEEVKGLDYITLDLSNELHHFNRYNALGKPNEDGVYRGGVRDFFVSGTLYQRRLAYGRYYIENDQIWFTLTNQECHYSTLTEYEWEGSREYIGRIGDSTLELQTYALRSGGGKGLDIVISTGPYGHDYVEVVGGDFVIERYTGNQRWDHIDSGEVQTFRRVDIELGDE